MFEMKVLELFGEPVSNGGQESFVMNVLSHMPENDMVFDVLTPYYCDNERYRAIVEDRGGRLYTLGLKFAPGKNRFNLIGPLNAFLSGGGYDAVHIHSGSLSVLAEGARAAKRAGVGSIIVHSHCAAERMTLRHKLVKFAMNAAMRGCPTHYVACSYVAGLSKFPRSIADNRLIILKNGVDLKKFAPSPQMRQEMRRRLGIADDEIVFGHVGRFSYQKNHQFLISVLRRAVGRGAKVKLVAVGSGETMEDVKAACRASGLEERVIFVGNTANVCDYYSAMDVFLLPSRFEGLPIVGVEAQASGLPCIFSSAVTREVALSPNVTFLPIGDGDEDRWAEEAVRLGALPRSDNSSSLRAAGFDIDDTVRAFVALYRTGVKNSKE